ncbi:hypothetical protein Lal_00020309 [Lupinus albus]|nr:hypothetical protein Lal_00020309 [Lupinus albus]
MDLPDQHTVAMKKTMALRDLQNDNQMPTSYFLKDPATNSNRLSGTKRSSSDYLQQSPGTTNGHLVYVRRKSEVELGKTAASENPNINNACCCEDEAAHTKEPTISSFPAFAPFPMASSMTSTGKPSLPISLGKSTMRLPPVQSNYVTVSSSPTIANPKGLQNVHWEERYQQLQMFLRKLDLSHQKEYIQMLRSLTSVELSKHAVELEKRSIQLSLEEVKKRQAAIVHFANHAYGHDSG